MLYILHLIQCGYSTRDAIDVARVDVDYADTLIVQIISHHILTKKNLIILMLDNCNTTHAVYLADCMTCKTQYIGCTNKKAKVRLGEHITASKNTTNLTRTFSGLKIYMKEIFLV